MLAVVYGLGAAIILPFILIAVLVRGGVSLVPMIIMLVLYPLLGFIGGLILAGLYNVAAKWVGGIRFTLEQSE